tara:strand:+ start:2024 stop:2230 length:207 start_codon:yes stop_codon:yes gene_type:complete
MKVKEINSILVYCKVENIYEIEYVGSIGTLMPEVKKDMTLYCHKYKKHIPVKEIIKTAEDHGYKKNMG